MIASVLVSARRRDCLHQTPIEAQPPRSGGAGPQARGSRNKFVPSCRPIQRVDLWTRRSQSVVRGLGGGAEQSPLILRNLDGKAERERVSNPSDTLPGLLTRDPECALRRMGLPKGEVLDGLARRARVSRRAHPFPSLNSLPQSYGRGFGTCSLPYLKRAERVERSWIDRRFWLMLERAGSAGSARLLSFLFAGHESLQVEGLVPQKHVVDRSAEFGRQNAECLSLAVILFQPSEVFLPYRVAAQEEGGRFGEGPLEMDVAHLAARLLFRLTGGLMGTLDQASVRDKFLDSGKTAEVVNLIEQGQREDLSNAGDGAKKVELPVAVLADLVNQVEPPCPG